MDFLHILTKAPNNSDSLIFIIDISNCKNKHIVENQKSSTIAIKSLLSYYSVTNKPNSNNLFISVILIENVYSCKRNMQISKMTRICKKKYPYVFALLSINTTQKATKL